MIFLFIPQKVGSKWYIVIYTINAIPVRIYCWRCIKISFLIGKNIYWWQHCLYKWLYSNFQIPKKLFCKMEMRKMCAFFRHLAIHCCLLDSPRFVRQDVFSLKPSIVEKSQQVKSLKYIHWNGFFTGSYD